jgi:hypothetical protein
VRVVVIAALIGLLTQTVPAASAAGTVITGYGTWPLPRLGSSGFDLVPSPNRLETKRIVPYMLPSRAHEGPGHWYLLYLHFRIEFSARNGLVRAAPGSTGTANVAVDTNRLGTSASIIFLMSKDRRGRFIVSSDSLGLVNGHIVSSGPELTRDVTFENFFPYAGVRPGRNQLIFRLRSDVAGMVKRVHVYPDTAIIVSREGPPHVRLELATAGPRVRAGKTFDLTYTVHRVAGITPGRVVAGVRYDHRLLRLLSPALVTERWRTGDQVSGRFRFRAAHAGRSSLAVAAEAGGEHPVATTAITVLPAKKNRSAWIVAGLAVFVALAAALLGRRALRKR